MGALLSRWRKKQSLECELRELDDMLKRAEDNQHNCKFREKYIVGKLIVYSCLLYAAMIGLFFFYFFHINWSERIMLSLPLIVFPFVLYSVKRFLHWYYRRRNRKDDIRVKELVVLRQKKIDQVKNSVSYKEAKHLLEEFDPDFKREQAETKKREENLRKQLAASQEGLRERNHSSNLGPQVGKSPFALRPMPLVREILPSKKSKLDKVVDYLVGDGTSKRYALICQNSKCFCHNGMALEEEFPYVGFRCAYCGVLNPPRKVRPGQVPIGSSQMAIGTNDSTDSGNASINSSVKGTPYLKNVGPPNLASKSDIVVAKPSDVETPKGLKPSANIVSNGDSPQKKLPTNDDDKDIDNDDGSVNNTQ